MIEFFSGDTKILTVFVKDKNNNPVDLTNATITLNIYQATNLNPILIKTLGSGITLINAVGGELEIKFNPSDTSELRVKDYPFNIRVVFVNGRVYTIIKDIIKLKSII